VVATVAEAAMHQVLPAGAKAPRVPRPLHQRGRVSRFQIAAVIRIPQRLLVAEIHTLCLNPQSSLEGKQAAAREIRSMDLTTMALATLMAAMDTGFIRVPCLTAIGQFPSTCTMNTGQMSMAQQAMALVQEAQQ